MLDYVENNGAEPRSESLHYRQTAPLDTLFQRQRVTLLDAVDRQILYRTIYTLDGNPASQAGNLPDELLPTVLSKSRLALGDLIPKSAWGASLANMLVDKSWQEIRIPLLAQHNYVCEDCGQKPDALNAHEIWDYYVPVRGNEIGIGIQKLRRIAVLCFSCHAMYHLGRAGMVGNFDEAISRMQVVNAWDTATCHSYGETIFQRFAAHSMIPWHLDLSILQGLVTGVRLNSRWTASLDDSYGEVTETRPKSKGTSWGSRTAILGIPWRLITEKQFRPLAASPLG